MDLDLFNENRTGVNRSTWRCPDCDLLSRNVANIKYNVLNFSNSLEQDFSSCFLLTKHLLINMYNAKPLTVAVKDTLLHATVSRPNHIKRLRSTRFNELRRQLNQNDHVTERRLSSHEATLRHKHGLDRKVCDRYAIDSPTVSSFLTGLSPTPTTKNNRAKSNASPSIVSRPSTTKSRFPYLNLQNNCSSRRSSRGRFSLKDSFKTFQTIFLLFLLFRVSSGNGVWWSPRAGTRLVNTTELCRWSRQVNSPQLKMCQQDPAMIKQIQIGIENGIRACQRELSYHRWNCSQQNKIQFARIMNQDIREAGFVRAITAAAITQQLTTACAKGDIPNCHCVNSRKLKNKLLRLEARRLNVTINEDRLRKAVDNFEWGGCRDKIEYGMQKSRKFLKAGFISGSRKRSRWSRKIQKHNEEVGRRAIKNYMKRACSCHGLTGSCTMWTCWEVMPPFVEVSKRLERKYASAIRVRVKNDGNVLKPVFRRKRKRLKENVQRNDRSTEDSNQKAVAQRGKTSRSNRRFRRRKKSSLVLRRNKGPSRRKSLPNDDIIFFKKSLDFCDFSNRKGSLGTRGRPCVAASGHCDYLCCKRGYKTVNIVETKSCDCKFQFCCNINCKMCTTNTTKHYCN